MQEFVQVLLDALSKWGPWLLVMLMLVPAVGLWRLWRQRQALRRKVLVWRTVKLVWWIATFAIFIWVLEVRLAPLTSSLVTLQAGRGERVPDISFRSVSDGKLHHLREFEGKVVLLNLWAPWCAPCVKELPALAALQKALPRERFAVVAVDVGRDTLAEAGSVLAGHEARALDAYLDSNTSLFRAFGAYGLPLSILIDAKGREIARAEGPADWSAPESVRYLKQLAER